jgi:hypothetical protein
VVYALLPVDPVTTALSPYTCAVIDSLTICSGWSEGAFTLAMNCALFRKVPSFVGIGQRGCEQSIKRPGVFVLFRLVPRVF